MPALQRSGADAHAALLAAHRTIPLFGDEEFATPEQTTVQEATGHRMMRTTGHSGAQGLVQVPAGQNVVAIADWFARAMIEAIRQGRPVQRNTDSIALQCRRLDVARRMAHDPPVTSRAMPETSPSAQALAVAHRMMLIQRAAQRVFPLIDRTRLHAANGYPAATRALPSTAKGVHGT
ncbi:hypothetical protein [Pandoraea faecigallinarum]|uniref:hypothetical protein n=1 Tax=Pandoraea faecigallinarum TaxID=656179 RepID=UPI000AE9A72B|nr:hypothetical protein [Pandoraea faecigallinarum]